MITKTVEVWHEDIPAIIDMVDWLKEHGRGRVVCLENSPTVNEQEAKCRIALWEYRMALCDVILDELKK